MGRMNSRERALMDSFEPTWTQTRKVNWDRGAGYVGSTYHHDVDADDPPRPCDEDGPCDDCDDYLCRQRADERDELPCRPGGHVRRGGV